MNRKKTMINGKKLFRSNSSGFTLIELVLVIAILGVLAVAALPSFFNISLTAARTNAMNATVGSIQSGLALYGANQLAAGSALSFPATLDAAATGAFATNSARLFTNVLQNGVSAQWYKNSATIYAYDTNGNGAYDTASDTCFLYTPAAGTFVGTTCP